MAKIEEAPKTPLAAELGGTAEATVEEQGRSGKAKDGSPLAAELGGTAETPVEERVQEHGRLEKAKDLAIDIADKAKVRALELKDQTVSVIRDPEVQKCTATAAGSALAVGAVGGAFGMAVGTATGSAAGLVPALFTFGLSIPLGGVLGGGMGLCAGAAGGSGVGAAAGIGCYKYRGEIRDGVVHAKTVAADTVEKGKSKTLALVDCTKTTVTETVAAAQRKADELVQSTRACAGEAVDCAKANAGKAADFATGTKTGVTCSSAVAGAVLGGTGAGALGSVAGGAVGMVPALFTFGLSIPVGAAVGLCLGATTGGAAGAVGGGSIGYGGYSYRKEIVECADGARVRAHKAAEYVKGRLHGSAAAGKAAEADGPRPVSDA